MNHDTVQVVILIIVTVGLLLQIAGGWRRW